MAPAALKAAGPAPATTLRREEQRAVLVSGAPWPPSCAV